MMLRTGVLLLLWALSTLGLAAQSFVERHSESYVAGSQSKIVLRNFVGDITVVGWDQERVQVDWAIRAYKKQQLDGAWAEISGDRGDVSIKTGYPIALTTSEKERRKPSDPDCVDYVLHVPKNVRSIELTTDDGHVSVSGVRADLQVTSTYGTVSIENVQGNVSVATMHAPQMVRLGEISGNRAIRLQSINGNIRLFLSRTSDVNVTAVSASGALDNNFGWDVKSRKYESGSDLVGRLGKGDATVRIEEVNGSVNVAPEPTAQ